LYPKCSRCSLPAPDRLSLEHSDTILFVISHKAQKSGAPEGGSPRFTAPPARENVVKKRATDGQTPDNKHLDEPADE
jgi:hypothetical protein